jgi:hypothetical protein
MKLPRQTGRCLEKDKRRQAKEVEPREKILKGNCRFPQDCCISNGEKTSESLKEKR